MSASMNRRIVAEITKLQALATDNNPSGVKFVLDQTPLDDSTSRIILGRIFPQSNIYNQAAFQIEMKLPTEYPFKAPEVRFITRMYHPNVSDDGKVCIEILNKAGAYGPGTPLVDIVKAIVDRIDKPDIDHALNPDTGSEYVSNRAEFDRKALEMVKRHGLRRH